MKIFLGVSYSSKVDTEGNVLPEHRQWVEGIINALERRGHTVFCALREDNWKINDASPGEGLALDLSNLDDADVFIAFLSERVSPGIQLELGYAAAKNKKIIITAKEGEKLSYINEGLIENKSADLVSYDTQSDLIGTLCVLVDRE